MFSTEIIFYQKKRLPEKWMARHSEFISEPQQIDGYC